MIYTLTINPAIDYVMEIDELVEGQTNRAQGEQFYLGGKGINVSIVLNNLGVKTTALGFIGGFTGEYVKQQLRSYPKIRADFTQIEGTTRINVKLKGRKETEINGRGSQITEAETNNLLAKISKLPQIDYFIISGSSPQNIAKNWYIKLTKQLLEKKIPVIIDIASSDLLTIAQSKPLLAKPNQDELEQLFGKKCRDDRDVIALGKQLFVLGVQHVIISQGKSGAIMICCHGVYVGGVPKGKLVNSVGAGDALVAGFIANFSETKDAVSAFKMGIACGSGSAYSEHLVSKTVVDALIDQVKIRKYE
ncbi:MAG: 1-phosphofructokinase [Culicoidibacterales bacterium]